MPPGGGIHAIKISRRLAKDFIRLPEFPVLPLQRLQALGNFARNAATHAAVGLRLLDPLIERLRRAADLRGNRSHRRPPRGMILLVLENQPNRACALPAKIGSLSCLPSLHLLKVRSLRQTRSDPKGLDEVPSKTAFGGPRRAPNAARALRRLPPGLEQPRPPDAPQEMVKLRSIKDDRAGRHISAPEHVFHLINNVCWRILHCTDSEPRVKDPAAVFWHVKGDRCSLVRIKTDYSGAWI
jgi:hypothetical protein